MESLEAIKDLVSGAQSVAYIEGVIFFHRFKKKWKEWESIAGNLSDWRRANTRNVSFFTLYGGQFTFSTQLLTKRLNVKLSR